MGSIIETLVGGFGGWAAGVGAALIGVWAFVMKVKHSERQKAERKARDADYERADEIRDKARAAIDGAADDRRSVDERLRDIEGFRDGD
ncbi:MAG: hypothetical protein GY767_17870 [Shimia sp.]|nr:hypothetical protein [Shimia sp.]